MLMLNSNLPMLIVASYCTNKTNSESNTVNKLYHCKSYKKVINLAFASKRKYGISNMQISEKLCCRLREKFFFLITPKQTISTIN